MKNPGKTFTPSTILSLKLTMIFALALFVQSCAINVTEKNIIVVDEQLSFLNEGDFLIIESLKNDLKVKPLTLSRIDGNTAKGLWIEQANSNAVIIFYSGNSTRIGKDYLKILPHLLSLNTDVVWLDHRGIGGSEGNPTMENLYRDGIETYNYVAENTNKKIILYGVSLGSFIAGNVTRYKDIAGLVLEASATNTYDWINGLLPWYAKVIYSINVEEQLKAAGNEKVVQEYSDPLFILVGEKDELTPVELSEKLHELSASKNKKIYIAKGFRHGNALKSGEAKALLRKFVSVL